MAAKRIKLVIILFIVVAIVVASFAWFGRHKPIEVVVEIAHYGKVQDTVVSV